MADIVQNQLEYILSHLAAKEPDMFFLVIDEE